VQRLSGAQAEARVVPRAPHCVGDDQTLRERAVVMSALCTDRKELVAAPGKQHRIVANVPDQHGAIGQFAGRRTERQVRTSIR
jgi:hypothetical protein